MQRKSMCLGLIREVFDGSPCLEIVLDLITSSKQVSELALDCHTCLLKERCVSC